MEEAAVMDGCNSLQMLIYVVVPVILPAIISVALFQFMWSMNDFLQPLIYLSSVEKYPVSLALKLSIDVTEATSVEPDAGDVDHRAAAVDRRCSSRRRSTSSKASRVGSVKG